MTSDVSEFPFVAELPKREQNRVFTRWEKFRNFLQLVIEHGAPVLTTDAAKLLGVSKQRVHTLVEQGRFQIIEGPEGRRYIGAKSLVEFAETERKNGCPTKLESTATGRVLLRLNAASK